MFGLDEILPVLARGAGVTVKVTLGAAAIGIVVAFVTGLLETSTSKVVRACARVYIEFFRGSSAIVQLFFLYFVLPLVGVSMSAYMVAIVGLGLNIGAYGSQIVRGAILGVDRGQREATIALNLPRGVAFRHVILPQAIPAMLPPFGNELIELLKISALVSLITLPDLTWSGKAILQVIGPTYVTEVYLLVFGMYLLLAVPLIALVAWLERRAAPARGAGREAAWKTPV